MSALQIVILMRVLSPLGDRRQVDYRRTTRNYLAYIYNIYNVLLKDHSFVKSYNPIVKCVH